MKKDDDAMVIPLGRPLDRRSFERLRKSRGLKMSELADQVDVSQPWLSRLLHHERSGKTASKSLIRKLCIVLDCQPEDILRTDDAPDETAVSQDRLRELQAEMARCSAMQIYGLITYAQALLDERLRDRPDVLSHLG